ncbi:hypothetical protein ACFLQI_01765 [Candidatus Undinarchaeota archaeon]
MAETEFTYEDITKSISAAREKLKQVETDCWSYSDHSAFILPFHLSMAISSLVAATYHLAGSINKESDSLGFINGMRKKAEEGVEVVTNIKNNMEDLDESYWKAVGLKKKLAELEKLLGREIASEADREAAEETEEPMWEVVNVTETKKEIKGILEEIKDLHKKLKKIEKDYKGLINTKESEIELGNLVREIKEVKNVLKELKELHGEEIYLEIDEEAAEKPAEKSIGDLLLEEPKKFNEEGIPKETENRIDFVIPPFQQQVFITEIFAYLCLSLNNFYDIVFAESEQAMKKYDIKKLKKTKKRKEFGKDISDFQKDVRDIAKKAMAKDRKELRTQDGIKFVRDSQAEIIRSMVKPLIYTGTRMIRIAEIYNWEKKPPEELKKEKKFRKDSIKEIEKYFKKMEKCKNNVMNPTGKNELEKMENRYKNIKYMLWGIADILSIFAKRDTPPEKPPSKHPHMDMFKYSKPI